MTDTDRMMKVVKKLLLTKSMQKPATSCAISKLLMFENINKMKNIYSYDRCETAAFKNVFKHFFGVVVSTPFKKDALRSTSFHV